MSWSRQWTPLLLVLALTPAGLCRAAPLQQAPDTDAQLREALDNGRWSDVKRLVRKHGVPDWLHARSKELTDEFRDTLAAPVKDRGKADVRRKKLSALQTIVIEIGAAHAVITLVEFVADSEDAAAVNQAGHVLVRIVREGNGVTRDEAFHLIGQTVEQILADEKSAWGERRPIPGQGSRRGRTAANVLASCSTPKATAILLREVRDGSPHVRAVRYVHDKRSVPLLKAALMAERRHPHGEEIARGLANSGGNAALREVIAGQSEAQWRDRGLMLGGVANALCAHIREVEDLETLEAILDKLPGTMLMEASLNLYLEGAPAKGARLRVMLEYLKQHPDSRLERGIVLSMLRGRPAEVNRAIEDHGTLALQKKLEAERAAKKKNPFPTEPPR